MPVAKGGWCRKSRLGTPGCKCWSSQFFLRRTKAAVRAPVHGGVEQQQVAAGGGESLAAEWVAAVVLLGKGGEQCGPFVVVAGHQGDRQIGRQMFGEQLP